MPLRHLLLSGLSLGLAASLAWAAPPEPPAVELSAKPQRLLLFKNGIGLVDATATLPPAAGRFRVGPLPEATFGSLWLTGTGGRALSEIHATQVMSKDQPATSIPELIEANAGKEAKIRVGDKWRSVRIREVPRRAEATPPEFRGYPPDSAALTSIPAPSRSDLVLLEEAGSVFAISMSQIQELSLPAENPSFHVERPRRVLEFAAGAGDMPGEVRLRYLTQGIAWMPSYTIDISGQQAAVTGKAVVINDLADISDAQVELVSGYPNLQFAYAPDAFSLLPLGQMLQRLRNRPQQEGSDLVSNSLLTQRRHSYAAEIPSALGVTPVLGQATEDMSFRPLKGVTLKKGERGYYTLFTAPAAYEHLYTWDVPDQIFDERGQYGQASPPAPMIWHTLGLNNSTTQAWTTGAATVTKDGRILGQDLISYTSPQCKTEVRITQALAIAPDVREIETDRKRAAANFYNGVHDLVTIQGELSLVNLLDRPATVRITKTITGEMIESAQKPQVTKLTKGLRSVNPRTQLQWKIEVLPGQEKALTLTYKYQVFVRG